MAGVDLQILFEDSVFYVFIKNRIIIRHILIKKLEGQLFIIFIKQ